MHFGANRTETSKPKFVMLYPTPLGWGDGFHSNTEPVALGVGPRLPHYLSWWLGREKKSLPVPESFLRATFMATGGSSMVQF